MCSSPHTQPDLFTFGDKGIGTALLPFDPTDYLLVPGWECTFLGARERCLCGRYGTLMLDGRWWLDYKVTEVY